jgi:mono/diheme cytochrome c family protein
MLGTKFRGRAGIGLVGLALTAALVVPVALGRPGAAPKVLGSPTAGKVVFASFCTACHMINGVSGAGTIGPNLSKVTPALDENTIVKAVTCGGATVMTKAAVAKYTTTMPPYGPPSLTQKQVNDVSAFIFTTTHPKGAVPKVVVVVPQKCPSA